VQTCNVVFDNEPFPVSVATFGVGG
jgi:hypothetical protein